MCSSFLFCPEASSTSTILILLLLLPNHHHHLHVTSAPSQHNNVTDRSSLLVFKSKISLDPHGVFATWNDTLPFCRWRGVVCGRHRHPERERVVSLRLTSLDLVGTITPHLANLTYLRTIDLSSNRFRGPIPQELSRLSRLQELNLNTNSLSGIIPPEISHCLGLQIIDLSYNMLGGCIPAEFGSLPSLRTLHLKNSNLGGQVPPSLWNLSSLVSLRLDFNQLKGSLPNDLGHALPHLRILSVYSNKMHGSIPMSLSNASLLSTIRLDHNNFSGRIPPNLGSLRYLRVLIMSDNHLEVREPSEWDFLTSLSNCTILKNLHLDRNNIGGLLPKSVVNLSATLQMLTMGGNSIKGSIPPEIRNYVGLTVFVTSNNFLSGRIPASIGLLKNLHILDLRYNKFSGEIPSTIGNLSQLNQLHLSYNSFSRNIPASLGNCKSLELLNLGHNKLTGTIPKEVFSISSLTQELSFEENRLTGTVPLEVGSLINIGILSLSGNKLSGQIPNTLGRCQVLRFLRLDRNFFEGGISTSLRALRGLEFLDLSENNLSGKIPTFPGDFPFLHYLNLSFNNFEGKAPRDGVFANMSAISVLGNDKLCGGNPVLHLPNCLFSNPNKKHKSYNCAVIILLSCSFLCLLFLFVAFCRWIRQRSRRRLIENFTIKEQHISISYAELVKATNGFSEENLIGSGNFGSVYQGTLHDHENGAKVIAVKVFNLQQLGALKSFVAECNAFRNIRHRNLIKILTACSSVDFKGNDFKAMIFEFKRNGSLESWLHPEKNDPSGLKTLNLMERINIAIDVASALEYLHHNCQAPIIHCDLKPSNILLDDDMTALVSDFGLAKFINKPTTNSTSTFAIKGTIGYIAPECRMTNKVSTHGDVYSYGILLMELFTGKRPTDGAFKDGLTLRTFVKDGFSKRVMNTMDERLLKNEVQASDHTRTMNHAKTFECISLVLRIGLLCTNDLPKERMEIKRVRNELNEIKNIFFER